MGTGKTMICGNAIEAYYRHQYKLFRDCYYAYFQNNDRAGEITEPLVGHESKWPPLQLSAEDYEKLYFPEFLPHIYFTPSNVLVGNQGVGQVLSDIEQLTLLW